jgi:hypothetical protein
MAANTVLDIFQADPSPFTANSLTASINLVPNMYGRLRDGFFSPRPIDTTSAIIEYAEGVVNLLPSRQRGGPPSLGTVGKRKAISVNVPHFPHSDTILAAAFQNVRRFGSAQDLVQVSDKVNEKLITMRNKHDITLEYLRWGAIKGIVLDSDGTTELVDMFDALGLSEESQSFALGTSTTDVRAKCLAVTRFIEENAKGLAYSGVRAFCSQTFFEALIGHEKVEAAWERWNDGEMLRNDPRRFFPFGGIVFEEHVGKATDAAGNVHKFIADDTARVVIEGASEFLLTYFSPGNMISQVNLPGKPIYVSQKVLDHGAGVEIYTESNPLPVCTRPELLVELTIS